MKKNDLIFVYGTLRRGERADLEKKTWGGTSFVAEDVINGELYNLGSYPGLTGATMALADWTDTMPSVIGEVFLIRDKSITILLDSYEGFPHLYNRQQVMTANGRKVWVYTYNHPVNPENLIESGDWCARHTAPITLKVEA